LTGKRFRSVCPTMAHTAENFDDHPIGMPGHPQQSSLGKDFVLMLATVALTRQSIRRG